MSGYVPEVPAGAFDGSRACFEVLIAKLADPVTGAQSHAELEEQLERDGRELLRSMLQDHLDLRTVGEERQALVAGADGVARTRAERGSRRHLMSVFGLVSVERIAYRAPGAANLYPADARLNLPAGKHSHGLRKLAAFEAVRGSFADAVTAIRRTTGVQLGKRQVEQLTQAAAADIEAFYAGHRPEAGPARMLLVMQYDGKGIVMLPEALREATAKAAQTAGQKLATRLSPGEKKGRKRMAELAAVYDAVPVTRTPHDIIARPATGKAACDNRPRSRGPAATGKWLTASVTSDIPAVIKAGFDEAARRDPAHERPWVVLVDGNRTQIEAIEAEAARRGVQLTIVLDFIHVLEYLWKAAWSFFEVGDTDAETWVADQATKILQGKAAQVAAGIRRRATTYGYSARERGGADTCANYLTAKKPYLDYPTALEQGWPIATGVIDGACRHLVKDRMDLTGARWGLPGAEAVLHLRALISNGDFDAYWAFHLHQEHQRVHHNRYQHQRAEFTLAA